MKQKFNSIEGRLEALDNKGSKSKQNLKQLEGFV